MKILLLGIEARIAMREQTLESALVREFLSGAGATSINEAIGLCALNDERRAACLEQRLTLIVTHKTHFRFRPPLLDGLHDLLAHIAERGESGAGEDPVNGAAGRVDDGLGNAHGEILAYFSRQFSALNCSTGCSSMLFGATPDCGLGCLRSKNPTPSRETVPRSFFGDARFFRVAHASSPHCVAKSVRACSISVLCFDTRAPLHATFGNSTIICSRAYLLRITRWMSPSSSIRASTGRTPTRWYTVTSTWLPSSSRRASLRTCGSGRVIR